MNQAGFACQGLLVVMIGKFVVAVVKRDETFRGIRQSERGGDEVGFVGVVHCDFVKTVMQQNSGAISASGVEVWIDLDGGIESAQSGADLKTAARRPGDPGAGTEGVAIDGVEVERAIDGLLGAREPFRIGLEVHGDLAADDGEESPCFAKIGIEIDGPFEHFDGGHEVEFVEAHRAVDGAHVELVGEGMARGRNIGGRRFFVFARGERGKDGVGEIVLEREEVAHVAVDFGGVCGAAFAKFPDLNEDAHARTHFLDGAFGDHVDVEFAGDLRPLGVAFGIFNDGAGGADDEAGRRTEAVGDSVGESDGEELIVRRRDAKLERNDGDGFATGGARRLREGGGDGEIFQRLHDFGGAGRAARGIFFEASEDEVVNGARETWMDRAGRRGSAGGDVVQDGERAWAGERNLAGDGLVEDAPEREDVGATDRERCRGFVRATCRRRCRR